METLIISVLTSLIVTSTMMHYHIHKVNELYKKYMDFETSSVKKFAEDIISKLPKNPSQEEWWENTTPRSRVEGNSVIQMYDYPLQF